MKLLDLTLPEPAANLALDEALLDSCEQGLSGNILRFWEPQPFFVVVGYANKVETEVNVAACVERQIPILRRCSGGGTVMQGSGCLNYSVILKIGDALQGIPQTNTFVMERQRAAVEKILGQRVDIHGHTDLVLGELKFSGNAQRRKKNFLLFHGTFLLDFEMPLIEACLKMPSKQPEYRLDRSHVQFLTNLKIPAAKIKEELRLVWNVEEELKLVPDCQELVKDKYGLPEWNMKF